MTRQCVGNDKRKAKSKETTNQFNYSLAPRPGHHSSGRGDDIFHHSKSECGNNANLMMEVSKPLYIHIGWSATNIWLE